MMAAGRFSEAQQLLADNSGLIVNYLQDVASSFGNIAAVFENSEDSGRLFYNVTGVNTPAGLHALFKEPIISNFFEAQFNAWVKVSHEERLEVKEIVDYFFDPIAESSSWKSFWNEQTQNKGSEIDETYYHIAGAVFFKISSTWFKDLPKEKVMDLTFIEDYRLFSSLSNTLGKQKEGLEQFNNKVDLSNTGKLQEIETNIRFYGMPVSLVKKAVKFYIKTVRANEFFQKSVPSEIKLYAELQAFVLTLIANEKKKEAKKAIKAIFEDLQTHHLEEFQSADRPANYLMNTIKALRPHASTQTKKNYKELLDLHTKHAATNTLKPLNTHNDWILPVLPEPTSTPKKLTPKNSRRRLNETGKQNKLTHKSSGRKLINETPENEKKLTAQSSTKNPVQRNKTTKRIQSTSMKNGKQPTFFHSRQNSNRQSVILIKSDTQAEEQKPVTTPRITGKNSRLFQPSQSTPKTPRKNTNLSCSKGPDIITPKFT